MPLHCLQQPSSPTHNQGSLHHCLYDTGSPCDDGADQRLARAQPEGYDDIPQFITDAEAKRPEDWDEEEDGVWEPPQVPNPDFKGRWVAKQISNPAYKGSWQACPVCCIRLGFWSPGVAPDIQKHWRSDMQKQWRCSCISWATA